MSNTAASGSDLVHSVNVVAGDLIDIKLTRDVNTPLVASIILASVSFT
jgi:hypothetical protein